MTYRCPLGKYIGNAPDYRSEREEAYHDACADVISVDNDPDLTYIERMVVEGILKRRYGPRRKSHAQR